MPYLSVVTAELEKRCLVCGRWFSWRKKWASCWEQVNYCSKSCRGTRLSADERALTPVLFVLLRERAPKTFCASEVARRVSPESWRLQMPAIRETAARLASFGAVTVTQRGESMDPRLVGGPFRVGVPPSKKRRGKKRR
ncbi:MAG: DUF3253 domain-containing protein [Polyangiales bacterium]